MFVSLIRYVCFFKLYGCEKEETKLSPTTSQTVSASQILVVKITLTMSQGNHNTADGCIPDS